MEGVSLTASFAGPDFITRVVLFVDGVEVAPVDFDAPGLQVGGAGSGTSVTPDVAHEATASFYSGAGRDVLVQGGWLVRLPVRDPRFTRPRLRELMPQVAAEGLTAERLALLAERVTRAEIVLYEVLNEALMRLAPGPWPEEGPVTVDAVAFGDLAEEIQLRMLDRLIGWTGNEGPVELGKLEALCSALEGPLIDALMEPKRGSFRRTLAGAMITLSGTKLTVERAPPRRTGMKKRRSG